MLLAFDLVPEAVFCFDFPLDLLDPAIVELHLAFDRTGTSLACLDRTFVLQLVTVSLYFALEVGGAALPEEMAFEAKRILNLFYLDFGFLDRYFDLIFEFDPRASHWTEADRMAAEGLRHRASGFSAHPRYLELAEAFGLFLLWDERGPPDCCEKLSGHWVCE